MKALHCHLGMQHQKLLLHGLPKEQLSMSFSIPLYMNCQDQALHMYTIRNLLVEFIKFRKA